MRLRVLPRLCAGLGLLLCCLYQPLAFGQMQLVSSSDVLDVYLDIKKPNGGRQSVHYRVVNKTGDELKVMLTTWADTKFGQRLNGKKNTDFILKPHADVSGGVMLADVPGMEADNYFYGDKPNEMKEGDAIIHAYVQPSSVNLTKQQQRRDQERRDSEAYNQQQREFKENMDRQEREQQAQRDESARQQRQQADAAAQAEAQRQQAADRQRAEVERQRQEAEAASQQAAQQILDRAKDKDPISQALANQTVQMANRAQTPQDKQQFLEMANQIGRESEAQAAKIQPVIDGVNSLVTGFMNDYMSAESIQRRAKAEYEAQQEFAKYLTSLDDTKTRLENQYQVIGKLSSINSTTKQNFNQAIDNTATAYKTLAKNARKRVAGKTWGGIAGRLSGLAFIGAGVLIGTVLNDGSNPAFTYIAAGSTGLSGVSIFFSGFGRNSAFADAKRFRQEVKQYNNKVKEIKQMRLSFTPTYSPGLQATGLAFTLKF